MFRITLDEYTLSLAEDLPAIYSEYHKQAKLVEVVESVLPETSRCFLSVAEGSHWPFLVLVLTYSPGPESGFHPGVVVIPETHVLFLGAGEHLLLYNLDIPEKIGEERVLGGFWGWERYGRCVLLSAELELAMWDITGKKRWSIFVEPPWQYTLKGEMVLLDVMGRKSSFSIHDGPDTTP